MQPQSEPIDYAMQVIGVVHSCYGDKFGVPRQPGLASAATGVIELQGAYAQADAVRGLEQFSHLWLVFVFHHTAGRDWHPLVRPPRLGGNTSVGVFASRSTFRPNPIGLSLVQLRRVETSAQGVRLHVAGLDLIEGTPILDIKPYVAYSDQAEDAVCGYAQQPPETMVVEFSEAADGQLAQLAPHYPQLELLIRQVLAQDPRPAYHEKGTQRTYGMVLFDLDVQWRVADGRCEVLGILSRG